ncbi:alpha-mannosidase [Alicyclobacillus fastidiosus]|uniref:Glycoside hydrolase family 38 C-terminal domain-containing protein n=1 Tax=Alicyclobacillus fastidiosus TaxID=392011 RepID=A0ABV5AAM5_9BACL|nr:alpha-mannosidase [Alicyclobacillus fastidiosus]WEH07714.1 glycoside hydrolase family 38 C-terminal domain-containing protein [Alicyclobacillus fastidiosus]
MTKPTLHMIGNAHIDPVWLWQWQEGFQEVKATFRSVLDRMNEFDDFVFVSSSAAFYEWIEQNHPAMFEEIQQRIREGRWEVVGGWWIQPDCNLPSGESFVRQGLYGQRYFHDKFGVIASVGYNVDSFGHHGMLPQILKKSGMDNYVFMRPGPHEKGLPGHVFTWESDDGSQVTAARILFEYCTWGKELDKHVHNCAEQLGNPVDQLMCFYGVGNHGGGPTKENLRSIRRLNEDPNTPELVQSTPNRYFAAIAHLKDSLPVVHDDLQHHASGCYAAHSGVKKWNRTAENLLLTAEKWSAVAKWVTGQPYPADFRQAWKGVLFNQFHDIMAGTSLEAAYDDARDLYGEAMAIASRGLNLAVQSLSWQVDIPEETGMKPIVVFNPHAWESRVNVELELGGLPDSAVLVDDADRQVPFQLVQSQATANGRHRLCFVAQLPSLGYRVYRLKSLDGLQRAQPDRVLRASSTTLENEWIRLSINPDTGFLDSLFDKEADVELLSGPAARPVVLEDESDTWSHGVLQYHTEIGHFAARSVQLVEHGDVKSVIRVVSAYGGSVLVQDFTMYRDFKRIDVHVTVNWHESMKMLKLRFPLNLNNTKATYEIPYGHIVRPVNGEEEPGQSWIDVTGIHREFGKLVGVSLLNDGKYSFDVLNKELGLTVLRSPIYAHHDPLVPEADGHYSYIDQGIQRFSYAVLPHLGGWEDANTVKRAAELNQKPVVVVETYHKGELPQCNSFLSVTADNVVASVVKQAEDDEDIVIRLYETAKKPTAATISLPNWGREFSLQFEPCEIKTIKIPQDARKPVEETNLLEWTC